MNEVNKPMEARIISRTRVPGGDNAAMCHTPHGTRHLRMVKGVWQDSNRNKYYIKEVK